MKRLLLMIGCLGGALLMLAPGARAAAPAHDDPLAGTTIEVLSGGTPVDAVGRSLMLLRMTMEPGSVIPAHRHPGPVSLFVEQGSFGTQFFAGAGQVTRAGTAGKPGPTITLKTGDNITMQAGDHLFYDGAVHTMRNDGKGEVVLLIAVLFDPSQPGFIFMDMGTPAAFAPNAARPSA